VGLEAPARAHAEKLADAELDQLLEDDCRPRAAHSGALDGDALSVPAPRIAEQAALGVHLNDVGQERLSDVLRAKWVAGQEARVRVVTGVRSKVDRHGSKPYGFVSGRGPGTVESARCRASSSTRAWTRSSPSAPRTQSSAYSSRTSRGAAAAASSGSSRVTSSPLSATSA